MTTVQSLGLKLSPGGGNTGRGRRAIVAVLAVLITAAGLLAVPSRPARADGGVVTVDSDTMRRGLFSAYMRSRAHGKQGLRDMWLSAEMVGYRQRNPGATQKQLVDHVVLMRSYYNTNMGAQDLERPLYEFMVKLLEMSALAPGGQIAAPIVRELMEQTVGKQLSAYGQMVDEVTAAQFQNSFFSQVYAVQDRVWGEVAGRGVIDATFAQAWNAHFGTQYNVSATASQDQLLADPLLATFVNTQALLDRAQNSDLYLAQAREMLKTLLAAVNERAGQANASVAALQLLFPVHGANATDVELAARKAEAAQRQQWIDGAAAAVQLLSTLVSFADPKAGMVVERTGRAAVQIATAINEFLPALASKGLTAALTSMSGIGLAANVLGAVQTLLPLFGVGQPTMDQQIMDEVRALRQQVSDLTEQMHDRFDRIELAMSEMFVQMNEQFGVVIDLVQATQAQLAQVTRDLAALTRKVDFWGQALYVREQEGEQLAVAETINDWVGYRTAMGREMTWQEYRDQALNLQFAATDRSTRVPLAAPVDTTDPMTVLNLYGHHGSVAYLNDYARRNLGLSGAVTGVPAIEYWMQAGQGYQLLLAQNPEHARSINGVTDKVLTSGETIQNAVRTFSRPQPKGSAQRLNPMFGKLIDNYRQTGFQIVDRLHQLSEAQYAGRTGYSMFGAPNQAVAKPATEPAAVAQCGGTVTRTRPSNVRSLDLQEAWVAQAGRADAPVVMCYWTQWVNVTGPSDPDGERPYSRNADLEIVFEVLQQWDGHAVLPRQWAKTFSYGKIEQYTPNDPSRTWTVKSDAAMAAKWTSTYKSQFEQSAVYSQPEEAFLKQKVRDWLYGKAGQYYASVIDEITTPGKPLHDLTEQLNVRFKLLQAYTRLGFARSMQQDVLIGLHLSGQDRIPSDVGAYQVTMPFLQARNNYCQSVQSSGKCVLHPEGVLRPQTGQDPALMPCDWAEPRADIIERCLNYHIDYRSGKLRERLEAASVNIAAYGDWEQLSEPRPAPPLKFVEGIPAVEQTLLSIRVGEAAAKH
ncbi:hypothetical protein [Micromonospora sp. NPDC092111]|uniref:hypothetical protein n=1 Tax=Micromonospora sp. NPDC092111 TaxID=3364289 RepID=UPI0037FCB625